MWGCSVIITQEENNLYVGPPGMKQSMYTCTWAFAGDNLGHWWWDKLLIMVVSLYRVLVSPGQSSDNYPQSSHRDNIETQDKSDWGLVHWKSRLCYHLSQCFDWDWSKWHSTSWQNVDKHSAGDEQSSANVDCCSHSSSRQSNLSFLLLHTDWGCCNNKVVPLLIEMWLQTSLLVKCSVLPMCQPINFPLVMIF